MLIREERLEKIRAWSTDPNAYACLQSGVQYFDHPSGFIAYKRILSGNVVLADPTAAPGSVSELISDFLKKHPNSVFGYLSDDAALAVLQASKKPMYFVNIGFERSIDLSDVAPFSSSVQGALKKARKAGLRIVEHRLSKLSSIELAHFQKINQQFIKASPAGKEIGFISRSMTFIEEPDVRFFSIEIAASSMPLGFCVLDPWYKDGKLERYQLHQFRLGPTKLWGVYFSVVALLLEQLQQEGGQSLSLGACIDISAAGNPALPSTKTYNFCRDTTLRLADRYHPLNNLSKAKLEFSGTNLNRYFAAPHKLPWVPLLRFGKAIQYEPAAKVVKYVLDLHIRIINKACVI